MIARRLDSTPAQEARRIWSKDADAGDCRFGIPQPNVNGSRYTS